MRLRFLTFLMMMAAGAVVIGCTEQIDDPAQYTKTIRAVLDDGSLQTRTCVADLYNVYMHRLQGMNTFVNNQTWPSWTMVED